MDFPEWCARITPAFVIDNEQKQSQITSCKARMKWKPHAESIAYHKLHLIEYSWMYFVLTHPLDIIEAIHGQPERYTYHRDRYTLGVYTGYKTPSTDARWQSDDCLVSNRAA